MSQTWLITGASSGIGKEIALAAIGAGMRVVVAARDVSKVKDLVAIEPSRVMGVQMDMTKVEEIREGVNAAVERFGGIGVLVSNAGFGIIAALEEHSDEQIARNISTNLIGPMQLIRAALPSMKAGGKGRIVLISAIAAIANHEGFSVYGGAKGGLEAMADALAIELKPLGISVTSVLPGPTRTEFIGRSLEQGASVVEGYAGTSGKFAKLLQSMNGKQTGDPRKIAELVLEVVGMEQPPMRLVCGKYANARAKLKIRGVLGEIEAWEGKTVGTDF